MKIKAVVFDVDGTLMNIEERFYHHYNKVLASKGVAPLDRKTYDGKKLRGALSDPIPDENNGRAQFWLDFVIDFSNSDFDDLGSPFEGVPEALMELDRKGYAMAIVTGRVCPPERVLNELHSAGIGKHFRFAMTNDEGLGGLDKSRNLIETSRRLGLAPRECAYIGDWDGDIIGARKAEYGLAIAVLSGGEGKEAIERHSPDVILECAAGLPAYLDNLSVKEVRE